MAQAGRRLHDSNCYSCHLYYLGKLFILVVFDTIISLASPCSREIDARQEAFI